MTEEYRTPEGDRSRGPGVAPELGQVLYVLDPGSTDRGYWARFHRSVMEAARDELARRRMLADATVSDLVASWSRALVPTALLAAAAAALLLLQPGARAPSQTAEAPVALEEMFESEVEEGLFRSDAPRSGMDVTFASDAF